MKIPEVRLTENGDVAVRFGEVNWMVLDPDGETTVLDASELPDDAPQLTVVTQELRHVVRRAGHCNGRALDPPCGFCESPRQCERCEAISREIRAERRLDVAVTLIDDLLHPWNHGEQCHPGHRSHVVAERVRRAQVDEWNARRAALAGGTTP